MKHLLKTASHASMLLTMAVMVMVGYCALRLTMDMQVGAFVGFSGGLAILIMLSIHFAVDWLRQQLEPKTGSGTGSTSLAGYRERSPREELMHALVHAMGSQLGLTMRAKDVGDYIRGVCDAMLSGTAPTPVTACSHSMQGCACTSATAGDIMRSAGYQADASAEAEIVSKGLTATRVTADQIQALMNSITWRYEQPEGTTSTFAHAYLGRFYLATGHDACVSPENFDAALGMKYAREQGEGKAREKLWELEGYALFKSL